jgi:16S rRNA processing protein RimM
MDRERVIIAEILRPRGNRGELLAKSESDVAGRFEQLKRAHARLVDGSDVLLNIESAWSHKTGWVLKFVGIDSISAAERFRGADLWLPLAERGALGQGEFFQSDLIGCNLVERATGKCLGVVEGWQQYGGGNLLMEVNIGGRPVLIPFVSSICVEMDIAGRTISVDLPQGLLDL